MKALLLSALVACAPYYRDAEDRGRAAEVDAKEESAIELRAAQAASAGHPDEAARILRDYIRRVPDNSTSIYTKWADYATAAGQVDRARALIRGRMAQVAGTGAESSLRAWIVKSYVAQVWLARALEETQIDRLAVEDVGDGNKTAVLFLPYSELRAALAPLWEAYQLRYQYDKTEQMHALLLTWLDTYGEADHPIIDRLVYAVSFNEADTKYIKQRATMVERIAPLVAAEPGKALVLCSEAYRQVQRSLSGSVEDACKRAAASVTDDGDADPVAAQLIADGDAAANAGELAKALSLYRRAAQRAPWSGDARRRMAHILDAMGAADSTSFVKDRARIADGWRQLK